MKNTLRAHAYIKGIDNQPRKVNVVASLVRNRTVADALVILAHTPRRAALPISKAIESANANLLQQHDSVDTKSIIISRITVSAGSRMRRYVPASRGRALPYEKISSNIFVEVTGVEKAKKANSGEKNTKSSKQPEKEQK
ncbi:50S ribosomal protein L22 [Candidatus Saccharibacteria bacterium]|nr:50S ribosomal protein L22 [Candidatus Saccharibacteria bacterium]